MCILDGAENFNMKIAAFLLGAILTGTQAFGASFSFTGTFSQDDNVQLFTFSLLAPGSVIVKTLGYAGGTNFVGSVIPDGGFDPILTVFTGTGPTASLFNVSNDAGCGGGVNTDPVTNACWDSFLTLAGLPAGTYTLALTQSDNSANGPTLGDGFGRDGQGNFTGPAFLGGAGSFIDANPAQRTANWAVDILRADDATLVGIPEPGTIGFAAAGLALLIARSRRK